MSSEQSRTSLGDVLPPTARSCYRASSRERRRRPAHAIVGPPLRGRQDLRTVLTGQLHPIRHVGVHLTTRPPLAVGQDT